MASFAANGTENLYYATIFQVRGRPPEHGSGRSCSRSPRAIAASQGLEVAPSGPRREAWGGPYLPLADTCPALRRGVTRGKMSGELINAAPEPRGIWTGRLRATEHVEIA